MSKTVTKRDVYKITSITEEVSPPYKDYVNVHGIMTEV